MLFRVFFLRIKPDRDYKRFSEQFLKHNVKLEAKQNTVLFSVLAQLTRQWVTLICPRSSFKTLHTRFLSATDLISKLICKRDNRSWTLQPTMATSWEQFVSMMIGSWLCWMASSCPSKHDRSSASNASTQSCSGWQAEKIMPLFSQKIIPAPAVPSSTLNEPSMVGLTQPKDRFDQGLSGGSFFFGVLPTTIPRSTSNSFPLSPPLKEEVYHG